jgi:hypothetical protein
MKSALSVKSALLVLAGAALLFDGSAALAANRNIILAPPAPVQSTVITLGCARCPTESWDVSGKPGCGAA